MCWKADYCRLLKDRHPYRSATEKGEQGSEKRVNTQRRDCSKECRESHCPSMNHSHKGEKKMFKQRGEREARESRKITWTRQRVLTRELPTFREIGTVEEGGKSQKTSQGKKGLSTGVCRGIHFKSSRNRTAKQKWNGNDGVIASGKLFFTEIIVVKKEEERSSQEERALS